MTKNYDAYKLVPFPKIWRGYGDVLRQGQRKHMILAFLEYQAQSPNGDNSARIA